MVFASIKIVSLIFCACVCTAATAEIYFVGCAGETTSADFATAANWSPAGVPGASDSVSSISIHSLRVENGSHLVTDQGVVLTVETSILVDTKGALSMKGLNRYVPAEPRTGLLRLLDFCLMDRVPTSPICSEIHVGSILNVTDGVLSGSGSIYGPVHCHAMCEIDVLTFLENDTMDFIGSLTIFGDLYMYQNNDSTIAPAPVSSTTMKKKRHAAAEAFIPTYDPAPLLHSVIAIGMTGEADGDRRSNLTVTGKMYIEKMSISVLVYPNASMLAQNVSVNMIFANGGFVFLEVSNITDRIIFFAPTVSNSTYLPPPYFAGIHAGRFPQIIDSYNVEIPGSGGGTVSSDYCASSTGVSLGVLFGPTSCRDCPQGFAWSEISQTCVATCADPTCSGHGVCTLGVVAYCDCSTGWTGSQCQMPDCLRVNGAVCNLKGICLDPVASGQLGVCDCQPSWDVQPDCSVYNGTDGSSAEVRCGSDNSTKCGPVVTSCTADGSQCACPSNWTGATCETPVCPNDCSGKGVCKSDRVQPYCECASSATGADCSGTPNDGGSGSAVTGLSSNTIIGIAVGSSLGFVAVVAGAIVLIVKYNPAAKKAVRPFSHRQTTTMDDGL